MTNTQEYEDEIELFDILKVIWKWKRMILAVTIGVTILAGVVSFSMTKIYKVSMLLDAGTLAIDDKGKKTFVDSLPNIQALIQEEVLNYKIIDTMKKKGIEPIPNSLSFDTKLATKGTPYISVSYNTAEADIETGIFILDKLAFLIQNNYKNKVANSKKIYDQRIQTVATQIESTGFNISNIKKDIVSAKLDNDVSVAGITDQISSLNTRRDLIKKNIDTFKQRIVSIKSEVEKVQKNSNILLNERNKFISNSITKNNILTAMVYSNTLQQNIAYANTLEDTITGVEEKIYDSTESLEYLQQEVNDSKLEKTKLLKQIKIVVERLEIKIQEAETEKKNLLKNVQFLKFEKSNIKNIQILRQPEPGISPVKPKKRLIVALAFISSLFLSIFASFIIEYLNKNGVRLGLLAY